MKSAVPQPLIMNAAEEPNHTRCSDMFYIIIVFPHNCRAGGCICAVLCSLLIIALIIALLWMACLLLLFGKKNKNVIVGQMVSRQKGQRNKLAGKIQVSMFLIINQQCKQAGGGVFSQDLYVSQTTLTEREIYTERNKNTWQTGLCHWNWYTKCNLKPPGKRLLSPAGFENNIKMTQFQMALFNITIFRDEIMT